MANVKIPTITYSRVCGYYRPISSWNKGKKREWDDRALIQVDGSKSSSTSDR